MTFNRQVPFFERTLSWRLFKRHHTHFNHIFWANRAASKFAYASTRPFQRGDQASVLFSLLNEPQRLATTLGEWADNYAGFNKWTQMAAVIAICGYLETYLAQVATAALESRPALVFGGTIQIDGAILLKANNKYDFYVHTEPLVRGDWQARISAYTRLFGPCPFSGQLSRLERLRSLRNDAGHSFGRDISVMKFSESSLVQPLPNIGDNDIQSYLELAESVATATESHLGPTYVGSYEVIRLFHAWRTSLGSMPRTRRELARHFSEYFNTVTGNPYGRSRGEDLIRYYDQL
ncbi:hypothetical protein [Burkholderia gladioli]|uniref:hypothetical protein n=1 Tax=Burkholderia gladioli TaxID=28095 RepID=UPI00163F8FB6|nr:hypothetical protein [Burkholderia gladioli]